MNKSVNILVSRKYKNINKIQKSKTKLDIEPVTNENVIKILKNHQEKSAKELALLKQYVLTKTNITKKFTNDNLEEASIDIILAISLNSSTYKNIKKENTIVINIGDSADYLFMILKGRAAVYEMEKEHKEMTGYEYFLLLQRYKEENEKYLSEKTIRENNLIFPIEPEDSLILDKIVLKILLSKPEKRIFPNYLDLMIEKSGMKYSDFELESYIEKIEKKNKDIIEEMDIENMTEDEKIEEYKKLMIYNTQEAWMVASRNEKKILEDLNNIDIEKLKNYLFLLKTKNQEMVTFYKCVFSHVVEGGDYFGDSEDRRYINKVISLSKDLELFCFKADTYDDFVRKVQSRLLANQVNFLLDNFFFRSIYKNYFEKYYFKFFELIEYKLKQVIIKENEPVQNIYFIKSGSVKISSNRSIIENHILIELIKNILLKMNSYDNDFDINHAIQELYANVNNNIEYLSNEMDIKNNVHIMTLQENNCLGSESYYYGLNYLYTAEANSEVVEIYQLSIDKLMKILKDKNHRSSYHYERYCEKNLKLFFDRLLKLNNMLLFNMKKNKTRKYGKLGTPEVFEFQQKINKN